MSLAANNLGGHNTSLWRGTEGFTQPELVEDSSTWKREIKLRKTAEISQIFSWVTEVESPKMFETQDLGLFKADSVERTAGCQKDSFFGLIQPGRCNSAQTLLAERATTWPRCMLSGSAQPAVERRTMIPVTCCTFQGWFLIHFGGGGNKSGRNFGELPKMPLLNILRQLKDHHLILRCWFQCKTCGTTGGPSWG